MGAVQKYGLKKWHLGRFKSEVEKFYKKYINDETYESDLTLKYQKRLERCKGSLFTFLELDGIPWHNNQAERALRHLAKQREISGSFREDMTHHYLVLLGMK
jgi:hypothetical protein